MSYVDGRFASPSAKRRALILLALIALGSFVHGMVRDLELRWPWGGALSPTPAPQVRPEVSPVQRSTPANEPLAVAEEPATETPDATEADVETPPPVQPAPEPEEPTEAPAPDVEPAPLVVPPPAPPQPAPPTPTAAAPAEPPPF